MNISFLYPQFLWAFTLLSIPIIIHLFNFRKYKELYFPNTLFLKHIKEQSKSANNLKNLLLLLLRLLIFSLLILAFAMPYSKRNDEKKASASALHAFYIDNSFSMNAANENGRLLIEAKKQTEAIVKNLPNSDYFMLTTNDFEGKHRRHLAKKEFLEELEAVEESPSSKKLNEVYVRQQADIAGSSGTTLYWLSDFQKNSIDVKAKRIDSSLSLYLLPLVPVIKNNLSIDSCWFESPVRKIASPEEIKIRITNHSEKDLENIPVKLSINGEQKAFSNFSIKGNSSTEIALNYSVFKAGVFNASIDIEDHPIVFDNKFYFSYEIREQTKILQIFDQVANPSFFNLFKRDSLLLFEKQKVSQLNYSDIKDQDLIVLDEVEMYSSGLIQEIQKFITKGGSVLIVPAKKNKNLNELNSALSIDKINSSDSASLRVAEINYASDFFQNVFTKQELQANEKMNLPAVYFHYKIDATYLPGKEALISLVNNDAFLLRYRRGASNIFLLSSPLDKNSTNFLQHAICVPVLYRMVLTSISSDKIFQSISSNLQIPLSQQESKGTGQYIVANGKEEFALNISKVGDQPFLYAGNQIKKDGIYKILKDKTPVGSTALNYNRSESSMLFTSNDELKKIFGEQAKNIHVIEQGEMKGSASALDALNKKEYWKYFVIAALVVLGVEVLVYRFWK
ncbi:MAG: BatA domain-containing protein [Bacteroidetes bacterium]|nr:BatA domain-containing protein [Bacteroidota bacterium]